MVIRSDEIAQLGAMHLSDKDWEEMAAEAELPTTSLHERLLPSWEGEFLIREGRDFWTLAPKHERALEFIKKGGRAVFEGRERSKKGRDPK